MLTKELRQSLENLANKIMDREIVETILEEHKNDQGAN